MLSGEAANTSFIVFGLTRPGRTHVRPSTLEANTITITPPMRSFMLGQLEPIEGHLQNKVSQIFEQVMLIS